MVDERQRRHRPHGVGSAQRWGNGKRQPKNKPAGGWGLHRTKSKRREGKAQPRADTAFWSGVRPSFERSGGNPRQGDHAPAPLNEGARSDLGKEQTRKPPTITNDTPKPHEAQSKSVISTTTAVEDEPNRKAMGYRKAPTAVRAGCGQHGRGRVGSIRSA